MRLYVGVVVIWFLISGCVAGGSSESHDLSVQLDNYERVMAQSRTGLQFSDGSTVRNCRQYLKARNNAEVSEGVANSSRSAEYRICDTLRALKSAGPVNHPYRSEMAEGEVLRKRLDLRSFRSSLGPASNRYHTLAQIEEELPVRVDGNSVVLESDDWYVRLEVVVRADVDNDGHEDWLVWLTDEPRDSNYRAYETLVIHRIAQKGLLTACPLKN